MDLGYLSYCCQGVNALHRAIHPENGFVWTEGKGIFLSPLQLFQGQLENPEHNKLGEFDRGVKAVHWGDNITDGLCYMCVVHDKNISIWKVEGHQPKLSFKQVRKVNIQPIQQGCLWNPGRDILCVLCPQQASLYYSHLRNKGSQVLVQLDRDKIRCGCWLTDGSRLVLCIGTTLSIYHWSDIDQNLSHCTHIPWTIPRLTGSISAIVPVSEDKLLYVAELPLESLCKTQDTFVIPDLINGNIGVKVPDSVTDVEIIRPKGKESSITETLFNIPRNPDAVIEDSSRIDCIQLYNDRDPEILIGCNVKGIITPDILLYQADEQLVIVGSNSQPLLQIYLLEENQLSKYSEILLDKNERPKGIACFPSGNKERESGILVLVGKKELSDTAFPSSINTTTMKSVLKFFNLKQGRLEKNQLAHTKSAPSIPLTVATNGHRDKNIDYDLITHQVINFNPAITKSVDNVNRNDNNNKQNGDSRVHSQITESKTRSVSLKDLPADNKENGYNDNHIQNDHSEGSDPPKRPVRKKKSLRGKQDLVERSASQSVQKPLMEYQSDSSDVSPRELHVKSSQTKTDGAPIVSILKEFPNVEQNSTSVFDAGQSSPNVGSDRARLERQKKIHSQSLKSETSDEKAGNELKLEPVTSVSEDFSREITMSLSKDTNKVLTNGILELGDSDANKVLEIERTSFDSEKRNFQIFDNKHFQESSELPDTKVQRYLTEKASSAETVSDEPFKSEQKTSGSNEQVSAVKVEQKSSGSSNQVVATGSLQKGRKQSLSLESLEDIDRLLKEQNEKITKLQEQMSALSRRVDESSCVLPTRYLSASKPDVVHVVFRCKDGFEIKRKFLLDGGRLQLEQVKQAFSLETVEIYIDDEPCVAGCNIDGYIPLRFESDSVIYISGKPAI